MFKLFENASLWDSTLIAQHIVQALLRRLIFLRRLSPRKISTPLNRLMNSLPITALAPIAAQIILRLSIHPMVLCAMNAIKLIVECTIDNYLSAFAYPHNKQARHSFEACFCILTYTLKVALATCLDVASLRPNRRLALANSTQN